MVNLFPETNIIYCDNGASLNTETITLFLKMYYLAIFIDIYSVSNGQVKRFISTSGDIARYLKLDRGGNVTVELI